MIQEIALAARNASVEMAQLSFEQKNKALGAIASALDENSESIIEANREDLARAQEDSISDVLYKRLKFDAVKLKQSIEGIESLIQLPDPIGCISSATELDTSLELRKISCPIGVLGIVFESRPDALVQISALALKSGNALLLKGGSEASSTNRVLADIIEKASLKAGIPSGWIALLETRSDVADMLRQDENIDLIIPRGSNAFVKYIMDNTNIPVMGHADGICHVYIDKDADIQKAVAIAYDSKCQYPSVCNAMETLLVHKDIADTFLPLIKQEYDKAKVEIRGDEATGSVIDCMLATEDDYHTEYNDLILSIKIVDSLQIAIDHINNYGSHHTDCIVTEDKGTTSGFTKAVDSACVFSNCSTRFADGFRFGLGAEVGVSTARIHARGPVGLEGLTIYKWQLTGDGQVVSDYADGNKKFRHRSID